MTARIGGKLDYSLLAAKHHPPEAPSLAVAVCDMAGRGWALDDIGAVLGIARSQVIALLSAETRHLSPTDARP